METLQLAQMLADLSDLDAAEPRAAHALVTANTTVTTTTSAGSSTTVQQTDVTTMTSSPAQIPAKPQQHRRVSSSSALSQSSGAGPRNGGTSTPFDSYLGRRLLTPPITRSSSSHGSMPGTPRGNDTDSDVDRASSLIALYDLRAKLKQYNDSNSLRQAREKVAALSGRQHSSHPSSDNLKAASPGSPPNPPSIARRHSQYTYPRS